MSETAQTSKIRWTPEQLQAIEDRGHDLALSASAGSGKTAVLTERVLQLITDINPETGLPWARLDHMLIITFTEKAARQMRDRIQQRILKALEEAPNDTRLRQAFDALASAWVMTIDAFCRRVVMEFFHRVDISPASRVPDAAEEVEIERLALDEVMEKWAQASADEPDSPDSRDQLAQLIRANALGHEGLVSDLRRLIHFLQSLDRPNRWLSSVRDQLNATLAAPDYATLPEATSVHPAFATDTLEIAEALREVIALATPLAPGEEVLKPWEYLAEKLEALAGIPAPFCPDLHLKVVNDEIAPFLCKIKNKGVCGAVLFADKTFIKNVLAPFTDHYIKWQERWFALEQNDLFHGAGLASRQGLALLALAEQAIHHIGVMKTRRGLISFNDQERLTLQILTDETNDGPSDIASLLQQRFDAVLVDEYQDTSPLQDAIIRKVSRSDDPTPGAGQNLFIVGDFKQSIYRFRHAEPTLFQKRLETYHSADTPMPPQGVKALRIDLNKNFRSRPPILDFVNHCFERLMDRQVGEMEYDDKARLDAGRDEPEGCDRICVEAHWMPRVAGDETQSTDNVVNIAPAENQNGNDGDGSTDNAPEFLEKIEAQTHWVAQRIRELTDPEGGLRIPDEDGPGTTRIARPGDCAILMRSISSELDQWISALQAAGLQVRTAGVNPLLTAPELIDLKNALLVADNPLNDIPLATLMRSPMFGFTDDELLRIRMEQRRGCFHEALAQATRSSLTEEAEPQDVTQSEAAPLPEVLRGKITAFAETILRWNRLAQQASADQVLDTILRDTAYEAWLMGRPDAAQRLNHLDFLRNLLRRLGRVDDGNNSLSCFLDRLDRAEQDNADLVDMPETITDQSASVHLLTIHKSKGLEFPVVFLPRLERSFRSPKLTETMVALEERFARPGIDLERRRIFPTLAQQALIDQARRKERAEELRLLYVAMTRARERLVLVAQVSKVNELDERWGLIRTLKGRRAGALHRLHASSPAALLGPIIEWLYRRPEGCPPWLRVDAEDRLPRANRTEGLPGDHMPGRIRQALQDGPDAKTWKALSEELCEGAGVGQNAQDGDAAPVRLLPPIDPAKILSTLPIKISVTQLRRTPDGLIEPAEDGDPREIERFVEEAMARPFYTRETTLGERKPSWIPPAEEAIEGTHRAKIGGMRRGSLMHGVLANVDLTGGLDAEGLRGQTQGLIEKGLIGEPGESAGAILETLDFEALAWVFTTEPGREMIARPRHTIREMPFTTLKSLRDFAPQAALTHASETLLMQGIIDLVMDRGEAAWVLDYKTDRIWNEQRINDLTARYQLQVEQYSQALKAIWQLRTVRPGLVFLDAQRVVWLDEMPG